MSKSVKPESLKAKSERIRFLFHLAETLCHKHRGVDALWDAVAIASKQERQHRATGCRIVGNIGRRASVETCAKLFALRGFVTPARGRSFESRADFVRAYGAGQACEQSCKRSGSSDYNDFCRGHRKAIRALDYTDLIGGK